MRLEHHLVGGYVRYISPHIIIIIIFKGRHTVADALTFSPPMKAVCDTYLTWYW